MAVTLGGVSLEMGVVKDSHWNQKEVASELHPLGSFSTVVQSDGFTSLERTIEGVTKSAATINAIAALFLARNNVTYTDVRGASCTVRIMEFQYDEVMDITNLANGTYNFRIRLLKR